MIYPVFPRVVSFTGGNPFPLTTRNLGASRVHSLFRRMIGKLSFRAAAFTSAKMRKATSPMCSIKVWLPFPVIITGNHITCFKSGKIIPESGNRRSVAS